MSAQRLTRLLLVPLLVALLSAAAAEGAPAGLRVIAADDEANAGALFVGFAGGEAQPVETVAGVVRYALLHPGTHRITLERALDADDPDSRASLATIDVDLAGGAYYTLVVSFPAVLQSDAPAWHTQEVDSALLRDELEALPRAGHASLRIVHAEPLAGAFGIEVGHYDPDAPLQADEGDRPDDQPDDEDDTEDAAMRLAIEPLQQSERFELPAGLYEVTARRMDVVWPGARLRYELQAGVAYSLYLMVVAPDVLTAKLAVDAAMPAPPYRERD